MKLQRLKLENFQGIKALELNFPDGCSATIYGDNATGKTTTFNAMTWLLFDKASTDIKGFTPKTKGKDGDMHHLDHSVEAEFIADDGRIIRLKKTYAEVYTKKRGSNTEEFTGHSVSYEIDGVPAKEKEYNKRITELCGGDTEKPKFLTMPNYFPERITWEARRKLLLEICGDITDDEVIDSNPELAPLRGFLLMRGTSAQYYTPDEYKKIAEAERKAINKELAEIPARIDELNRSLPESLDNADEINSTVEELEKRVEALMAEEASLNSSQVTAFIREQIAGLRADIAEKRAEYESRVLAKKSEAEEAWNKIRVDISKRTQEIVELEIASENKQHTIERLNRIRQELVDEYNTAKSVKWDEGQETCPTCKQRLPEAEIQKLKEEFNLRKSQKLEDINKRGKETASKEAIAKLQTELDELNSQLEVANMSCYELKAKLNEAQASTPASEPSFNETEEYATLMATLKEREEALAGADSTTEGKRAELKQKIVAVKNALSFERSKLTAINSAGATKARIAELEEQEAQLGERYEYTEQGIYLCELFTRTKVRALTDKINKKFKAVSFRLFQEQINGGIKEDCEVMIPSPDGRMVPYTVANNAARINAGLEIISVLSEHWGITMPVFVDNAEAVTHLAKTSGQTIRLVVSEADKKLRLEIEKE